MYEILISINSNMLDLFNIDEIISKMNCGNYIMQIPHYADYIAFAFESTLAEIMSDLPYTLKVSEGDSSCDGVPNYNVDVTVETDVSTIFRIHKDVYTKFKDEFDRCLHKKTVKERHPEYPDDINMFFQWLEGEDVEGAISVYLAFLINTKYNEMEIEGYEKDFTAILEECAFGIE